jgi:hypothetical protein
VILMLYVSRLLVRFSSRNGFINTRARAHPKKKEWDELCKDDSQDGPNCHTDTGHNAQVATTKGKSPFHNPHV